MEEVVPPWEEFVECNLLSSGVISGVMMMSPRGTVTYTWGNLSTLKQADLKQFVDLFSVTESNEDNTAITCGVKLNLADHLTDFKIYKKTFCSVYCASSGGSEGLVISKLPHGILVCSYRHPVTSSQASAVIENFCDRLRV